MAERLIDRASDGFVSVMRRPVGVVGRSFFDLDVVGAGSVPKKGPILLAANHLSHLDPVFVTLAAQRNVRYLAVDELFGRSKFFDGLVGFFGTIPMSRTRAPIGALQTAVEHLQSGGAVGVFPEGRRVNRWGEARPNRGAAWLSVHSGAPLIPMAIIGTERTLSVGERRFRRAPVRVWIGQPIEPNHYSDRVDPQQAMMNDWYSWVDERLAPWS